MSGASRMVQGCRPANPTGLAPAARETLSSDRQFNLHVAALLVQTTLVSAISKPLSMAVSMKQGIANLLRK